MIKRKVKCSRILTLSKLSQRDKLNTYHSHNNVNISIACKKLQTAKHLENLNSNQNKTWSPKVTSIRPTTILQQNSIKDSNKILKVMNNQVNMVPIQTYFRIYKMTKRVWHRPYMLKKMDPGIKQVVQSLKVRISKGLMLLPIPIWF